MLNEVGSTTADLRFRDVVLSSGNQLIVDRLSSIDPCTNNTPLRQRRYIEQSCYRNEHARR